MFSVSVLLAMAFMAMVRGLPAEWISVSTSEKGKWFDRIVVATFENKHYNQVRNTSKNFVEMEERGVLLTNFYGTTHPSLPNYLAQVGGSHFDVKDDEAHDIDAETVFDRLEDAGLDWLSVQENYPTDYTGCMTGSFYDEKLNPDGMGELGYYARKHNPPMSFISVSQNETRCQEHVISEIMFDRMLESGKPLPEMIYYTPNMLNDCHDFNDLSYCDPYLPRLLEKFDRIDKADEKRTLFVVTWDEDNWQTIDWNHIHTVIWGAGLPKGETDGTTYNHFSLTATILANWGLETLHRHDENAQLLKLDY
ncbi:MAG: hypothetical protein SGCHY_002083 [Lobulomycetales sp.]